MNSSFSPGAGREVEAFLYPSTSEVAPPNAAETETAEHDAKPVPAQAELPRISEEEITRLVAEARSEGIVEGMKRAQADLAGTIAEERERTSQAVLKFQDQCKEYFAKAELELVHLSLAIAAKILHRESQVDRMVVAGLVKVMLEKLHQNTKVMVRVRPEDETEWQHYFREHRGVQIVGDQTLEPKGCVLESELGAATLGLDSQLKEVEKGFFDLLAQRPQPK